MIKALIISAVLSIISLFSKIECQVILTQKLLEEWYGDNLTSLEYLKLANRQIVSIDLQTFNGLTKLQHINFQYNELTSIEPLTFNGLTNLERLDLSNNQITSIDSETFKGLNR